MQQSRYIRSATIAEVKKYIERLYAQEKRIVVTLPKTRSKSAEYTASIEGVYAKFFTVKDDKLGVAYTIQYIDLLTGTLSVSESQNSNESDILPRKK